MKFVLDTNAATYLLGGQLAVALPFGHYGVSVISEIELLSYPSLAPGEETAIQRLLTSVRRLPLDEAVRDRTIALRREHSLKLPDAVIAATAINWGATLLSNDSRLSRIPALATQTLALK